MIYEIIIIMTFSVNKKFYHILNNLFQIVNNVLIHYPGIYNINRFFKLSLFLSLEIMTGKSTSTKRAPDLVQRNHRIGDSKDEVDIVLRHLLCDQGKRWVIL